MNFKLVYVPPNTPLPKCVDARTTLKSGQEYLGFYQTRSPGFNNPKPKVDCIGTKYNFETWVVAYEDLPPEWGEVAP